jgi:hypothetical protein
MPRLTQFFVFTLLLALLSGCAAPAAPAPTLAPTFSPVSVLPTAAMTPTYEPTPTLEPSPTPTPEPQLGGDRVAVLIPDFDSRLSKEAIVALIEPYINTPTPPDVWPTKLGDYLLDNGQAVQWGDHFMLKGAVLPWAGFPALLRDIIEIDDPHLNGKLMISVYEIPAQNGSNFLVSIDQDNATHRVGPAIFDMNGALPASWFEETSVIDDTVVMAISKIDVVDGRDFVDAIRPRINKMIIVEIPIDGKSWEIDALEKMVHGELLFSDQVAEGPSKISVALLP